MGRPRDVSDEEIIAAGRKLQADGPVNATRIWAACGRRGRPIRMFDVWQRWLGTQPAEGAATVPGSTVLIPEPALRLAAGLKAELMTGIDRTLTAIYQGVEEAVKGRYQGELSGLASAREAHAREMQDALAALGEMSDAQDERDARILDLEAVVASTLRQRDVSEALRGVGAEQHSAMADRLQIAEAQLERERSLCVDLKIANVRVDEEVKALTRQLDDLMARFKADAVIAGDPLAAERAQADSLSGALPSASRSPQMRGKARRGAEGHHAATAACQAPSGDEVAHATNGVDGHVNLRAAL